MLSKLHGLLRNLKHFIRRSGQSKIYYTRKLSWFVQILDFVPSIVDGRGHKREPSELKEVIVASTQYLYSFLCLLNSTLFYYYLTVWSDCRNLNKREVFGIPFDPDSLGSKSRDRLKQLAMNLMDNFLINSKVVTINYTEYGLMKIQCIYPKFSKKIIDDIDCVLGQYYGLTEEELDFIINYDIKYRMGSDAEYGDE